MTTLKCCTGCTQNGDVAMYEGCRAKAQVCCKFLMTSAGIMLQQHCFRPPFLPNLTKMIPPPCKNHQLPNGLIKVRRRWGQRHPQGANSGSNGKLELLQNSNSCKNHCGCVPSADPQILQWHQPSTLSSEGIKAAAPHVLYIPFFQTDLCRSNTHRQCC
jgi:hypothetical protein